MDVKLEYVPKAKHRKREKHPVEWRICEFCGDPFPSKYATLCSIECRMDMMQRVRNARKRRIAESHKPEVRDRMLKQEESCQRCNVETESGPCPIRLEFGVNPMGYTIMHCRIHGNRFQPRVPANVES